MMKVFKQLPEPLQRQILYKLGYGLTLLFVTIVLFFYTMELFSVLACVIIMVFCVISAFALFRRAVVGDYVAIRGECLGVTLTAVRKRTKTVILRTDDNRTLKIMIKHRLKKINAGSAITVYAASNVPIYENNGAHLLYSYLALDIKRGENKND